MAPRFRPGSFVLHADFGPCAVVGVQSDAAAGDCLTLARMASPEGIIRIPLAKLARAPLQPVGAAEAQTLAVSWEPPRKGRRWKSRSTGGNRGRDTRASELRMMRAAC